MFTAKKQASKLKDLRFSDLYVSCLLFYFPEKKKVKINIQPKCALMTKSKWGNDHFEGIFKDVTINCNMDMKEMLSWILILQNFFFYFIFWGTFRRIDSSNVIVKASVR